MYVYMYTYVHIRVYIYMYTHIRNLQRNYPSGVARYIAIPARIATEASACIATIQGSAAYQALPHEVTI